MDLAVKCYGKNVKYDDFKALAEEEARLFREASGDSEKEKSHCNLLRLLMDKVDKGSVFSAFLEYRYRLRQRGRAAYDLPDNGGFLQLLSASNDLHWSNFQSWGRGGLNDDCRESLSLAHFLFNELFEHLWKIRLQSLNNIQKLMNNFHSLNGKVRRSKEGKALFHSLALCHLLYDHDALPVDWLFLFTRKPYDSDLLRQTRLSLIEKSPYISARFSEVSKIEGGPSQSRGTPAGKGKDSSVDSCESVDEKFKCLVDESEYVKQCNVLYQQLLVMHGKIREENAVLVRKVQENRFSAIVHSRGDSGSLEKAAFENQFQKFIKNYERLTLAAFYLATLGPKNDDLRALVLRVVPETFKIELFSAPYNILIAHTEGSREEKEPLDSVEYCKNICCGR
jgi:hypothetical protein